MEGATPVALSPSPTPLPRRMAPRSAPSSSRGQPRHGVFAPGGASGAAAGLRGGHSLRPSVVFSAPKLHVTVGGVAAFYAAELTCAPEHAVTVAPSNLPTSLRVAPSLQVFTRQNWSTPQYFRVAAVGGTACDDSGGSHGRGTSGTSALALHDTPRAVLQVIEHTSSSLDARFDGSRLLFLPGTIVVHVSPRDGAFVFATGRALATAAQLGKGTATAAHHGFRQLQVDTPSAGSGSGGGARGSMLAVSVARSSLVPTATPSPGNAAAIAAVDAANSAVTRRLTVGRRSVVTGDSAAGAASVAPPLSSAAKDAQSFVKVACRKLQTVLLQRNGVAVALGKREGTTTTATATGGGNAMALDRHADAASDAALSKVLTNVDCGDDHIVAITEHGYLLTWGDAREGRLGRGTDVAARAAVPRLLRALLHKRVVQVACGARHALALAEDGDVFAWGSGQCGALGLATSEQSKASAESVPTPMEVLTLKHHGVATLACGDLHSAVVLTSGALLTCGWAEHGRLGRDVAGAFSSCFARVDLRGRLCTFVACGGAHTLALTACHGVFAFGGNASGQLGVGDGRDRATPTRVAYFEEGGASGKPLVVTSLAAGKAHSMAVTQDARVFAWGSDEFGQCGVGAFPQLYTVPHLVASAVGLGATQAACGDAHSVLLAHTSPRELDALETQHPARYAQLADRYEQFVREDKQRRRAVLLQARQREDRLETAVRQRKPPLDPSVPRGPAWQRQLQDAAAQAHAIVALATPVRVATDEAAVRPSPLTRRPQTANASLASALAREKDKSREGPKTRPSTAVSRARGTAVLHDEKKSGKVRCSSATLWRQTRLFTFQVPHGPPEVASSPRSPTSRPPSRRGHPLKLTAQARQTLGRLFHGDTTTATTTALSHEPNTMVEANQMKPDHVASAAAAFPTTRPKSAPSRAAVTSVQSATRAS